jgi:hypothetical protein
MKKEFNWDNLNLFGKIYVSIICIPFLLLSLFPIVLLVGALFVLVAPIHSLLLQKVKENEM